MDLIISPHLSPPSRSSIPILKFEAPDPFPSVRLHPLHQRWRFPGDSLSPMAIPTTRTRSRRVCSWATGPVTPLRRPIMVLSRPPQPLELPFPSLSQVSKPFTLGRVL